MNEQQRAAYQAIGEITADLGVAFTLTAVAAACETAARSQDGNEDSLKQTAALLRQLASIAEE
jgi:hypothetical protein